MRLFWFKRIITPWYLISGLLVSGLLAFFLASLFVLFYTHVGFQFTLDVLTKLSGGRLNIESPSGTLLGEMHFKKVIYKAPTRKIRLDNVSFRWSPLALLQRKLYLSSFHATHLILNQTSSALRNSHSNLFTLSKFPFEIVIQKIQLTHIQLHTLGSQVMQARQLTGHLRLTQKKLDVALQAKIIAPFLVNGQLNVRGDQNHYAFELDLAEKKSHWKLVGQGNQKQVVFRTLNQDFLNGTLSINGWVGSPVLLGKMDWKFSLVATHLKVHPVLPLLVNGALTGEGKGSTGKVLLTVDGSSYDGQPLSGHALFDVNYPMMNNLNAEIFSGKDTLVIHGNVSEKWDIQWNATIESLNKWWPAIKGQLNSQGRIMGGRNAPNVAANLAINQLATQSSTFKNLQAKILFNSTDLKKSTVFLEIQQIKNNFFEIPSLIFLGNLADRPGGISLNFRLQPGIFQYAFEGQMRKDTFLGGTWDTNFTINKIITKLDLQLMGKSHLQGELVMLSQGDPQRNPSQKNLAKPSRKIQGTLKGKIEDLSFLSSFTHPTVRNIQGQVDTEVKIAGTIAKPEVKSVFTLKGKAFVTVPNLYLEDIQLIAKGEKQTIHYEGQARSEDTVLKLMGKTFFQPKNVVSEFNLFSPNFLVTNTREIKIYAAPQLNILTSEGKTLISGTVQIPKAEVKPLDFSNIITLPEDIEYITSHPPVQSYTPFSVQSDFLVTLGNDVYLKFKGLEGYLEGSVRIKSRPLQPTIGIGRIHFKEGSFQIKGRKLTIHQGFFNFNGGPLTNPSINIRATRKIQINNVGGMDSSMDFGVNEILVGVEMTGNIRRNRVRLFSEPAGLNQSNILAYLITGQSITPGSSYFPLIMEAANSLGGGSNSFSEKIKRGMGLSEFAIKQSQHAATAADKTQGDAPTLVFGKLLSPVFYINYTVSLLQPLSGFQARYQIAKHWLLQASVMFADKNASSIDIIRTFESKD